MLPTHEEIIKWSDEKLATTIRSGESINWHIRLNESQSEVDSYIETLYIEAERRSLEIW